MRVLLCAPRLADDARDPRARRAHALGHGLVAAGHRVTALVGEGGEEEEAGVELVPAGRTDPCPTHWMRSSSVHVTRRLRGLVRERAPDVVHVLGWERLTDDLVLTAARAGVPSVLELFDHRITCLLETRRRPENGAPCTRTYGPYECVPCADQVPPRATWVPVDQAYLNFGRRAGALGREVALARARLVPDEDHGQALVLALGTGLGPLLVPPSRDSDAWLSFHLDLYRRVRERGAPPEEEAGEEAWFEERMRAADEAAWDEAARREVGG